MTVSRRMVLAGLGAAAILPRSLAAPRPGLYDCEGCEAVAEREAAGLPPLVKLAADDEPGERMVLTGRVVTPEGAPAADVVVYAHHTDANGLYSRGSAETIWSRRHGLLRGWAKTGADGVYGFDTIKPAPYPDMTMPAHVHLFIGEPGHPPYYIDDVVFAGEYGVDDVYRARMENRGGDGIVHLSRENGVWRAVRDIALEPHA
ncbi:MAG: hypothetical protein QM698_08930 [Micropepsaceae bacterium]